MFDIHFVTEPRIDAEGWPHAEAEIVLGLHRERLPADLSSWTPVDYERQWRVAVRRLVEGLDRTCLLTSYRGPDAGYHFSWPMWREGDTVYAQEHLVFLDQLDTPFDPHAAWESVGPRTTATEFGEHISEWQVPLADLMSWETKAGSGRVSA